MRIEIVGWESEGLRCPDITVDLRRSETVPSVTLVQMPNGTGKTTTLDLLNATLSGSASDWSRERVEAFRRPDDTCTHGRFKTTLMANGKPLSLELTLDYEARARKLPFNQPG